MMNFSAIDYTPGRHLCAYILAQGSSWPCCSQLLPQGKSNEELLLTCVILQDMSVHQQKELGLVPQINLYFVDRILPKFSSDFKGKCIPYPCGFEQHQMSRTEMIVNY